MDTVSLVNAVVEAWKQDQALSDLAATGVLVRVADRKQLGRQEVCKNVSLLGPVIQHMGTSVALVAFDLKAL